MLSSQTPLHSPLSKALESACTVYDTHAAGGFGEPFGHELPSGLSLRVEDKAERLSRAVVT